MTIYIHHIRPLNRNSFMNSQNLATSIQIHAVIVAGSRLVMGVPCFFQVERRLPFENGGLAVHGVDEIRVASMNPGSMTWFTWFYNSNYWLDIRYLSIDNFDSHCCIISIHHIKQLFAKYLRVFCSIPSYPCGPVGWHLWPSEKPHENPPELPRFRLESSRRCSTFGPKRSPVDDTERTPRELAEVRPRNLEMG